MKKFALGALGLVALLVGGVAAAASMQPDTLHVERSVVVAAAPADVFPYANEFDKWQQWNPWRELDPSQKETFSENKVGAGAWYEWQGNDDVGRGRMEITSSVPTEKVVYDLHFIEPFESRAVVTFAVAPEGEGSKLTWGFDSEQNFGAKMFALFADMDAMLGADFQRGLDKLKPLAEASAKARIEAEQAAAAAAVAAPLDAAVADGAAADPAAAAAK